MNCPVCQSPVVQASVHGPAPTYCSNACAKRASYKRKKTTKDSDRMKRLAEQEAARFNNELLRRVW